MQSHADNPDIPPIMAARIRWNLGNAILEKHGAEKSKEAEELGREAMEILQQSDGKNSPELVAPLHLVADVLKYQVRHLRELCDRPPAAMTTPFSAQDDKELERNHLYQEIAAIENHSLANPREPGQDRNENADSKEVETMEVDEVQGVGEGPQPARQTAATPRPAAFAIGLRSPQLTQRHDSPVIREDADAEEAAMQQEYEIAFIEEKIEIAKKILPPVEVDAAAGKSRRQLHRRSGSWTLWSAWLNHSDLGGAQEEDGSSWQTRLTRAPVA